jgi:hypothetical protein
VTIVAVDAEAMLRAERPRRKPPFWLLAVFVPLYGLIGAGIWYATTASANSGVNWLDINAGWFGLICAAPLIGGLWGWGLLESRRARREMQALADCRLLDRSNARCVASITGLVVGARDGCVSYLDAPLRRLRVLMALPLLNALSFSGVDQYTLVQVKLTAAEARPFRRLVLAARSILDTRPVAAVHDAASDLRHVELESIAFHQRYSLEADHHADAVAVRGVFTPTMIVWLTERQGADLFIELRTTVLTVAAPGHLVSASSLEALIAAARRLATVMAPATAHEQATAESLRRVDVTRLPRFARVANAVGLLWLVGMFGLMFYVSWVHRPHRYHYTPPAASFAGGAGTNDPSLTTPPRTVDPGATRLLARAGPVSGRTLRYHVQAIFTGTVTVSRAGSTTVIASDEPIPSQVVTEALRGRRPLWECVRFASFPQQCHPAPPAVDLAVDFPLLLPGGAARLLSHALLARASHHGGVTCMWFTIPTPSCASIDTASFCAPPMTRRRRRCVWRLSGRCAPLTSSRRRRCGNRLGRGRWRSAARVGSRASSSSRLLPCPAQLRDELVEPRRVIMAAHRATKPHPDAAGS